MSHLKQRISSLCSDFSSGSPLPTLLSHFTTDPAPSAIEHGAREIAPFLGREFTGRSGLTEYFRTVADLLTIEWMHFDPPDTWTIHISPGGAATVWLRGRARFAWKTTQQAWNETFAYRLEAVPVPVAADGNNNDDDDWKVRRYEVWADTGAAYLASKGLLAGGKDEGIWATNPLG
ncbi:hypothetical protein BDV59DRAFT_197874 [Aspergillus ambiguus]|uniref:uncharacterized protein n=1 Tax=Aspergillus ambiguus TaxID=176160 RepID=UPI003CCD5ABA